MFSQGVLIDWESQKNRSVLYDIHDFFLTRLCKKPARSPKLPEEMDRAISELKDRLENFLWPKFSELFCSFSSPDLYRFIFYLERLCTGIGRGDMREEKFNKYVLPVINAFTDYEQRLLPSPNRRHKPLLICLVKMKKGI